MGLAPGDVVDRYKVEALLGEGGMASVYRVRHQLLHSTHALKVLNPDLRQRADLRDRFLSEGRILSQLSHPHIVRVTDLISLPEVAGLVMDFIEGPTLKELIAEHSPLSRGQIQEIMSPVLDAVAYAHRRGIVHRDLKPDNIIVSTDEGALRPVVLDFGIARVLDGASISAQAGKTHTGMVMGTPSYMSPEQIRGEAIDQRTDVFALGTILYELVAGHEAFDSDSRFDLMRDIVDGKHRPIPEDTPHAFRACIVQSLAPLAQRLPDCEAFRATFEQPDPEPEPEPTPPARRLFPAMALVGALLLLGMCGGGALWAASAVWTAPGTAPPEAPRDPRLDEADVLLRERIEATLPAGAGLWLYCTLAIQGDADAAAWLDRSPLGEGWPRLCPAIAGAGRQETTGPGYRCDKAQTVGEKTICSQQTLSEADWLMVQSHGLLMSGEVPSVDRDALRRQHREWFASRDRGCGAHKAGAASMRASTHRCLLQRTEAQTRILWSHLR